MGVGTIVAAFFIILAILIVIGIVIIGLMATYAPDAGKVEIPFTMRIEP